MKMADKRLDAWIPEELKNYLAERSEREKKGMNIILAEMIQQERAREQGAVIEQQSLPIIRDIVQSELRKATAQLRTDIREDMQLEIVNEFKAISRRSDDRIAALVVRACRDASIAVRMLFAVLARSFSAEIARTVLEDARIKAGKELAPTRKDEQA